MLLACLFLLTGCTSIASEKEPGYIPIMIDDFYPAETEIRNMASANSDPETQEKKDSEIIPAHMTSSEKEKEAKDIAMQLSGMWQGEEEREGLRRTEERMLVTIIQKVQEEKNITEKQKILARELQNIPTMRPIFRTELKKFLPQSLWYTVNKEER